jgi:hypothetical protein
MYQQLNHELSTLSNRLWAMDYEPLTNELLTNELINHLKLFIICRHYEIFIHFIDEI